MLPSLILLKTALFGLAAIGSLVIDIVYVYTLRAVSHHGDHEPAASNKEHVVECLKKYCTKGTA